MTGLKNILVIFLCLQTGFSNSVLLEVFHFPSLIEHYLEHREKSPVGIIEFIRLHYTENEHQKENSPTHHHDSLPFRHSITNIQLTLFTPPPSLLSGTGRVTDDGTGKQLPFHSPSFPDNIPASFWHPPRTA